MDLHQRIRKLIYVPQLSGGRKTFLHFYWDGKAWSLRDFSMPGVEPKPHYWPDPRLTVEDILALARAPGAFCCDAPEHPVKDVRFWHETTIEANRRYLGIEPDAAAASAATPAAAPPPARPAPRLVGGEPNTYQDRLRLGFWRYRDERFAGAEDLFDPRYQPGGTQPPVFKTEHAHRNVLVRPDAGQDEIDAVWSAIPDGMRHKWFRSMASSQALGAERVCQSQVSTISSDCWPICAGRTICRPSRLASCGRATPGTLLNSSWSITSTTWGSRVRRAWT